MRASMNRPPPRAGTGGRSCSRAGPTTVTRSSPDRAGAGSRSVAVSPTWPPPTTRTRVGADRARPEPTSRHRAGRAGPSGPRADRRRAGDDGVEHGLGEPARGGVLLADVVAAGSPDGPVRPASSASAPWPNRGCGRGTSHPASAGRGEGAGPGERPEGQDDAQVGRDEAELGRPASRRRCRVRRGWAGCPGARSGRGDDAGVEQFQTVRRVHRRRLVRQARPGTGPGTIQSPDRSPGEHAARAVPAVRRGGEAQTRTRGARDPQAGHGATPVRARTGTRAASCAPRPRAT